MLVVVTLLAIVLALSRVFLWNSFPIVFHDMVTCKKDVESFDSSVVKYLTGEGFIETAERPPFLARGYDHWAPSTRRVFRKHLIEGVDCFVYIHWEDGSRTKNEFPLVMEIGARVNSLPWQQETRDSVKMALSHIKEGLSVWCNTREEAE